MIVNIKTPKSRRLKGNLKRAKPYPASMQAMSCSAVPVMDIKAVFKNKAVKSSLFHAVVKALTVKFLGIHTTVWSNISSGTRREIDIIIKSGYKSTRHRLNRKSPRKTLNIPLPAFFMRRRLRVACAVWDVKASPEFSSRFINIFFTDITSLFHIKGLAVENCVNQNNKSENNQKIGDTY